MFVRTAEPFVEAPNGLDVEMAISKLKSGKGLLTIVLRRPSILVRVLLLAYIFCVCVCVCVYVVFAQTLN